MKNLKVLTLLVKYCVNQFKDGENRYNIILPYVLAADDDREETIKNGLRTVVEAVGDSMECAVIGLHAVNEDSIDFSFTFGNQDAPHSIELATDREDILSLYGNKEPLVNNATEATTLA